MDTEMTVVGKNDGLEDPAEESSSRSPGRLGIRHLQVLLLFLGMMIGYCLRVIMSIAVVAMTNSTAANPDSEKYDWTPSERSTILSSFFWGYTVIQVPSSYIAGIWSGQKLLSLGILLCGVLNLVVPLAARYGGLIAVCACRVGMGLSQGCLLPCVHTLLSKWAPPSERARLGTFAYAGAQLGTVVAFPIAGLLAASAGGWQSLFYVFGTLAILWGIVFFVFGADTPSMHSTISYEERKYIENSLRTVENSGEQQEKLSVPWKDIFTSVPMWALIIAHCGQNWGYWTLLTEMPSYMNAVLNFKIEENGGISALPYLAMWILSFPVSWLSDYALQKNISRATIRKICNTIAHWGPALALVGMGFVPKGNTTLAVAILVIAVGLNAGSLCGFQINHIDLSPNFAGTMMSITNCIASVIAIIAPLICGEIVSEESNVTQWHTVFYLSASIYFIGNLIFIIFGKAEVQSWNDPATRETRNSKKESASITYKSS
ncbi:hypothetical protein KM043_015092 [Ampulex compressa]|nr:hypothetical protein KM043_015092 [Ampulex compressa]